MSAIDKRTLAAQHLLTFRRELLEDLGGEAAVSAAQLALVEVATRTRLYLDHVDAHLLERETLITRRNRLLPLVEQRTRLAESLVGVLSKLGLERRPRPAPSLEQYVARYGGRNGATTTNDEATSHDETPRSAQDGRSDAGEEEDPAPGPDRAATAQALAAPGP